VAGNQISKDLFVSILAMDAYNRGYDAGISDGVSLDENGTDIDGLGEAGQQIGAATIMNVPLPGGSEAADFYAIAYEISADGPEGLANQTVISYRGTDSDIDWFEGWTIGAGMVGWNTSKLAPDFYTAVTGQPSYRDEAPDTIVTGHSLRRRAA